MKSLEEVKAGLDLRGVQGGGTEMLDDVVLQCSHAGPWNWDGMMAEVYII